MRRVLLTVSCLLFLVAASSPSAAQAPRQMVTAAIDESSLVTLGGNTSPAAARAENDRGAVADDLRFEHMLLLLKRDPDTEARLQAKIEALHTPGAAEFHQWLTPEQLGAQFGANSQDVSAIRGWLESHGFTVNQAYKSGLVLDFSGTARQVREAFHTQIHRLVLPNGEQHISNVSDPQIPAALAAAVSGVPLHDFFGRPHLTPMRPVSYDHASGHWQPHFTLPFQGTEFNVVAPYDFATIYNLLPLWNEGFTGKGVTIAAVEDSNLANPGDWSTFRQTFGLTGFRHGKFKQVYPGGCANPGQNGDEIEAALDVEWASAAAPDANIILSACADTSTTSGLDLAILNLLETQPPDIISDSYGLCETVSGHAEVALENFEAELATLEGVTFFIAQGDTGADECAPAESTAYSTQGINSGDNTASAFAVDVGGTDFMAQYNADTRGIPVSTYWSATNNPTTLASALSYVPEIPWNDGCTSKLIYTDPVIAGFSASFGPNGFCNSSAGQQNFLNDIAGSGGPSTCFTGTPSIPGVVSGTCKGNPKPSFQSGVPGVPHDGLRDQPDISLFAGNGVWGSFYVECLSDTAQGGAPCTAQNDAILLGGGGTSFASPAMAGILALIEQRFGRQGDANFVLYALAARQFSEPGASRCNASQRSGELPAASCIFNDITLGDVDIPCGQNSDGHFYDCHGASSTLIGELSKSNSENAPAYPATVGYDLATGLGSVNATNLFNAWPRY